MAKLSDEFPISEKLLPTLYKAATDFIQSNRKVVNYYGNGWMDRSIQGLMYRLINGLMDELTSWLMDGLIGGLMDGLIVELIDGWMYVWMDGWTDGRMDGWTDGRIDGWMDSIYSNAVFVNEIRQESLKLQNDQSFFLQNQNEKFRIDLHEIRHVSKGF